MEIERAALLAMTLLVSGAASSAATPPAGIEALALQTLSEYLSRPVQEIEVVSSAAIDWPDSSVGCPQPDRDYLQVITPGHYVVLQHDGKTYRVHMAKGRAFVCDHPAGQGRPGKQLTPVLVMPLEHLQSFARIDLARRLQVPADQVQSTEARPVVWRDASLGCPVAGETYKPGAIKGYVLELSYHGRAYTYHADTRRVFPCPSFEDK